MTGVEDWVTCPHCGGDCDVSQPAMYHSRFECQDCGEHITTGWVYFEDTDETIS